MNVKDMAKKYVLEYRQGNPFTGDHWTQFNVTYKSELHNYLKDKTLGQYMEYYHEMFRREKERGQIMMVDFENNGGQ